MLKQLSHFILETVTTGPNHSILVDIMSCIYVFLKLLICLYNLSIYLFYPFKLLQFFLSNGIYLHV